MGDVDGDVLGLELETTVGADESTSTDSVGSALDETVGAAESSSTDG